MKNTYDICILGAGASGLAAALEASLERPGLRIAVLEKNAEPGRKLRATGNGRCNIANEAAPGVAEAMEFLARHGIVTRTYESGLMYPYSESAADVAELLAARLRALRVDLYVNTTVTAIERREPKCVGDSKSMAQNSFERREPDTDGNPEYVVFTDGKKSGKNEFHAKRLIVAMGGKSGPSYGTTGDAYKLLGNLGHTVVRPIPVLAPIECAEDCCESIAGIRAKGKVTLFRKNADASAPKELFTESGEIQFTKFGLSGICIFNMTRHMRFDREEGIGVFEISVDLYPDGDLTNQLIFRRAQAQSDVSKGYPSATVSQVLTTILRDRLADYVLGRCSVESSLLIDEMTDGDIAEIATQVHRLLFRPTGIRGWKESQCTAGGVSLDEIDPSTAESRIHPGLYITGELQDYDGPCGGYNLTHAWRTGMHAGRDAARSL